MSSTQKLALVLGAMLALFFTVAIAFVTDSHASMNDITNPSRTSTSNASRAAALIGERVHATAPVPEKAGYYELVVANKLDTDVLPELHGFVEIVGNQLQQRVRGVEVLRVGDPANGDHLGTIMVQIHGFKERAHWRPARSAADPRQIPSYIALKVDVRTTDGSSNWDGVHWVSSDVLPRVAAKEPTFPRARYVQIRELVRDALDRLPGSGCLERSL